MTDNAYEMASAYCDGELSSEARGVVESDDRLLDLVSEIMTLRAKTVESLEIPVPKEHQPSQAMRKAQLAAASAAYDDLYGQGSDIKLAATSGTSPISKTEATQLPAPPQRAYPARMFALAAGLVIVAGVGVVALRGSPNSTDTASESFDAFETDDTADLTSSQEDGLDPAANASSIQEESTAAIDEAGADGSFDEPSDAEDSEPSAPTTTVDESQTVEGDTAAIFAGDLPLVFPQDTPISAMAYEFSQLPGEVEYVGCAITHYRLSEIVSEVQVLLGEELLDLAIIELDQGPFAVTFDSTCRIVDSGPISE